MGWGWRVLVLRLRLRLACDWNSARCTGLRQDSSGSRCVCGGWRHEV